MKLRSYLEKHSASNAQFAKAIGVSSAALHRYMTGERIPRSDVLARITQETAGEVQPNDFYSFSSASDAA